MLNTRKMTRVLVLGYVALYALSAAADATTTPTTGDTSMSGTMDQGNQQAGTAGQDQSSVSPYSMTSPRPTGGAPGVAGETTGMESEGMSNTTPGKSETTTTTSNKKHK